MNLAEPTIDAVVCASFGRSHALRVAADGALLAAVTRGKRGEVAVGDRVTARSTSPGHAVIESVEPRRNEIRRSDGARSKVLAANVDQAAMVIAAEPPYDEGLLLRVMIACETAGVPLLVIGNKLDLPGAERLTTRLAVFEAIGYRTLRIAARPDPDGARAALVPLLEGRTTLMLGESGMGKSTLVNLLAPDAVQSTAEVSKALSAGRHTTTASRAFELPGRARLIDSPGFQTFGLDHLSSSQRVHGMREFVPLLGRCRYGNCSHRTEPGCAIRDAVGAGSIDRLRYELFVAL